MSETGSSREAVAISASGVQQVANDGRLRLLRRILGTLVLAVGSMVYVIDARAAESSRAYPVKPVRLLVGSPAGSGTDVLARAVAQKLTERWDYSVVVDNRSGATGEISLNMTAHAPADGYTVATLSVQNITAMLMKIVSVDIPHVFAPVAQMMGQPYLLVVTPALPVNSAKELIAYSKVKPLAYASSGVGSVVHLGMELFKFMTGTNMTHIPYKGSGLSMVDVMGGRVDLAITNTLTATPLVKSGRIRAIAITSAQRKPAFPDLPTIAEAGVPRYELNSWYGMVAPLKTPNAIVQAISADVNYVMNLPEIREKLSADGAESAPPNTPMQFKQTIDREIDRWRKVISAMQIRQ
jgi:tripartite-type tricarboxylate transporter receptor subunit TctC